MQLSYCESDCGRFTFINHSTAAVVEIEFQDAEETKRSSVFLDWSEWDDFVSFIKELDQEEKDISEWASRKFK